MRRFMPQDRLRVISCRFSHNSSFFCLCSACLFFFIDPAPTEIYTNLNTLSLHDALPISICSHRRQCHCRAVSQKTQRDRSQNRPFTLLWYVIGRTTHNDARPLSLSCDLSVTC